MRLKSHKKMFYYSQRIWRNKIISDGLANTQDDYVYYYIHPFGRLGRLNSRATMTEIRASIVDDDFLLHEDMEKLLVIYDNLSSLNLISWDDFDILCGGRENARSYYNKRFSNFI